MANGMKNGTKKKNGKEIEKTNGGGPLAKPQTLGRGFDSNTSQEDLIIPRCKLLQALSPEVVDGIEGCKPGIIINGLTSELLPGVFIPVFQFIEYIKFNPKNSEDPNYDAAYDPGALIWKITDPTDKRIEECNWGPNGEKPKANKIMNFFSYFIGSSMPVVISFLKTSYKAGKKLNSLARLSGGDMFASRYTLKAKQEEKSGNKYFVFEVNFHGKANKEEVKLCEGWYDSFKHKDIEVAPIEKTEE